MKKDYFTEIENHLQAIKNLAEEAKDNGVRIIILANASSPEQKKSSLAVVGRTSELRETLIRIALNDGSLPVMKKIIMQVGTALQVYEVSERLGISPGDLSDFFDAQPKPKNDPPPCRIRNAKHRRSRFMERRFPRHFGRNHGLSSKRVHRVAR